MITWSTRPSIRAGPDTVGPLTMAIEGTTPEFAVISLAAPAHPSSARPLAGVSAA